MLCCRFIVTFLLSIAIVSLCGNRVSAETLSREGSSGVVLLECKFESFHTTDWGIGHDIHLPLWHPEHPKLFMHPRNDGGDWKPFYWQESKQGRSGRCLEIRIVNPNEAIRGCGADMVFRGPTALPPGKEVTVRVWTNVVAGTDDFVDAVLGWEPGDNKGITGGVQDYVSVSRRTRKSGWELLTLRFVSHEDPEVGDIVGLAFGGRTTRATEFRDGPPPKGPGDCRGVVAIQPVLSAFFDDLRVTLREEPSSQEEEL